MTTLAWIIAGGLTMSAIAMIGSVTSFLSDRALERIVLPLVALAAGTLLGGAFFHMIPEGSAALAPLDAAAWIVAGFGAFLVLEQFLHWHQSHGATRAARKPMTYLVLIGDAAHNFLGGLAIASTFLLDARAGVLAWIAAAAHEIPQELGDFGILVHGNWPRRRALLWNFISALTFPCGALVAYAFSQRFDVAGFVLFGAGNFIYIAASDLIPEIKAETSRPRAVLHTLAFGVGLALMFLLASRAAGAQGPATPSEVLGATVGGTVRADTTTGPILEVFVREGCPYCSRAKSWLPALRRRHPDLQVRILDIGRDPEARTQFERRTAGYTGQLGVPAFFAGGKLLVGWDGAETTGRTLERLLYPDRTTTTPEGGSGGFAPPPDAVDVRLFGRLSASELGLPLFTLALGAIDGFNPCAIWVLVFVLSLLVGLKDRRRIILIGGTFLLASGLVYFAFMAAWLNVFLVIGVTRPVQLALGAIALLAATVNLKDSFALGAGPSLSIPERAKPGIYAQIRRVVRAEHIGAALGAAVVLAILVNTVELLCTSGLPAIYTQVLASRELPDLQYYAYLALYNAAYMLDDAILLVVATVTLRHGRLQEGGARVLKLVSGIVMLALAVVLLFRPGWLARLG